MNNSATKRLTARSADQDEPEHARPALRALRAGGVHQPLPARQARVGAGAAPSLIQSVPVLALYSPALLRNVAAIVYHKLSGTPRRLCASAANSLMQCWMSTARTQFFNCAFAPHVNDALAAHVTY